MPAPSIGRESYLHRAAKEVMVRWLREAAADAGHDNYTSLGPLTWRVNRPGPAWGVWMEYPISPSCDLVWDEQETGFDDAPPTYDWCVARGYSVAAVADVAVQHKGRIAHAVEIVHKSPCSPAKRALYEDLGIWLWEVPAKWVMAQTARPRLLKVFEGAGYLDKPRAVLMGRRA